MSAIQTSIGIAGAGRVAQALGRHLQEHGQPIVQIASRSLDHARAAASFIGGGEAVAYSELSCDRVLIAVPDRAVAEVTTALPIGPGKPAIAIHCCGAYGASLLEPLRQRGVSCGALHPLQTFATAAAGYHALPGCAFAVDGDADAVAWAEGIARLLDGMILRIPEHSRAIYHAAAAMASNHLTSVLDAAVAMMAVAGISEADALRALDCFHQHIYAGGDTSADRTVGTRRCRNRQAPCHSPANSAAHRP